MIRKFVLPFLAVLGVAVAIAMVIQGNRTAPAAQPAVQSAGAPFSSYVFGPGIVEASTENIAIGTPASGIVTAIYVKWGDRVKTGVPLFKVDTRDLDAQILPAKAKVKEVEAQLLPANAKVNESEATLAKAENRLKVGEGLETGVSISAEEVANRRFDVEIDKASLASAKAQVDQIKSQMASAEAQVEQIKAQIELHTIRAPVSGRILQMKTRLGEYAQTGVLSTPLMLLGDDTRLHVRVDIDENDAWRFQPCAPAVASVRGNPEIKAPLQYVRTDPDVIPKVALTGDTTQRTDTRVLQVIYSFDPASLPLYVGQLMDVFIEAPSTTTNAARTQNQAKPCGESAGSKAQAVSGRKP
ncbi:MAG TPA: biotin/lipoyl-binding protein [Candidatus Acidoferrales bacterium]|nr:biotin/lipoyl-binding protein [Candidatus Acidoferrales bacterium]